VHLTRRTLQPGEIDYELLWLSVSASSLGLAIAWFAVGLPWPSCVFHDLTGLPCVTCGATRSVIEILHGHFVAAAKWNPLVFVAVCCLLLFNVYAFLVLITRAPRLRVAQWNAGDKKIARITIVGLLATNWIYLLANWRSF
jgi:Protein of unknown function (DUF2752)